MREHTEARRVATQYGTPEPRATGLRKYCPRCDRGGWVFLIDAGAVIIWDGPTLVDEQHLRDHHEFFGDIDVDVCSPVEVFRPWFGCGTCKGMKRDHW